MNTQLAKKILIVAPAWVGDLLMMHSLLQSLKQQHPKSILHTIVSPVLAALTEYMPEVSKTIKFSCAHGELGLQKRYHLGKKLKKENYDQAIILPNSFKSALIPFFAKIPIRTGWKGECRYGLLNDLRPLDPNKYPLMVQRFVALGLPKGARLPKIIWPNFATNPIQAAECAKRFNIDIKQPIVALCPGAAYGISKQWPAAYFKRVVLALEKKNFQLLILGSKNDQAIANDIMPSPHGFNLAGKTTLSDAVNLLSYASVVVSHDSGLMHIAAALKRPLVAIYGSSTPAFTPPLAKRVKILEKQLNCRPCFKRVCPLTDPVKHMACLKRIQPQAVLNAIEELSQ